MEDRRGYPAPVPSIAPSAAAAASSVTAGEMHTFQQNPNVRPIRHMAPPVPHGSASVSVVAPPVGDAVPSTWPLPHARTAVGIYDKVAGKAFKQVTRQLNLEMQPMYSFLELLLVALGEGYTLEHLTVIASDDPLWQGALSDTEFDRSSSSVPVASTEQAAAAAGKALEQRLRAFAKRFDSQESAMTLLLSAMNEILNSIQQLQQRSNMPSPLEPKPDPWDVPPAFASSSPMASDDTPPMFPFTRSVTAHHQSPRVGSSTTPPPPPPPTPPLADSGNDDTAVGGITPPTFVDALLHAHGHLNAGIRQHTATMSDMESPVFLLLRPRVRGALAMATANINNAVMPVRPFQTTALMFSSEVRPAFAQYVALVIQHASGVRALPPPPVAGAQVIMHASADSRRGPTRYNLSVAADELAAAMAFFRHVRRGPGGKLVYRPQDTLPPRKKRRLNTAGSRMHQF